MQLGSFEILCYLAANHVLLVSILLGCFHRAHKLLAEKQKALFFFLLLSELWSNEARNQDKY